MIKNAQSFLSLIGKLSKREKLVLYVAGAIIAMSLLDRLVILPIFSKMDKLNKDIIEFTAGIKKNVRILAYKDRVLSEREKYTSYFLHYESKEEEMASLLKEIEGLANKSSVYLIDIKPGGIRAIEGTDTYFINLNCEAQMEQLIKFMYSIEESNRLLSIDKYRLTPKSQDSSIVRCGMSISKVVTP